MRFKIYPLCFLFFIFLIKTADAQTFDIATARSKPAGAKVTVKGIVLNGSELGVIRYIQDNTGGAALYASSLSNVKAGDSIIASGAFKDYNGLLEMDPVDSFSVLSSGNTLPQPKILSAKDAFTEKYESMLVEVEGVNFTTGGSFSGNTNYKIQQGSYTGEVRIYTASDLVGAPIPGSKVNITGIMSQFKTTYQLMPRGVADFEQAGPVIRTPLMQSDIKTDGFKLAFETKNAGNTIIKYGLTKNMEIATLSDKALLTSHSVQLTGLQPATFYYAKAWSVDTAGDTSASQAGYFSTASLSSGKIKVYFNHTIDTTVSTWAKPDYLSKAIDDSLVAFIGRAKLTLDIAIYSIDNQNLSANISSAINAAYTRGVRVRMVVDGGLRNYGLDQINSNIPVVKSPQGSNYTIMHNKFVVMDAGAADPNQPWVWAGSTNWTDNQINDDYNSVIQLQDQALARAYTMEFEEMFGSSTATPNPSNSRFGQFKLNNTPHLFNIGGHLTELYFSPSDGTNNAILHALNTADKEIYFSQLVFTRNDLAYAIRNKVNDGVFAAGIVDDTANAGFTFNIMKAVMKDRLLIYKGSSIYHHKYAIIDQAFPESDPQVIIGSHNWSTSADTKNDENTLILHNDTVANMYYQEWIKRYFEQGGTDTLKRDTSIISGIQPSHSPANLFQIQSCQWQQDGLHIIWQNEESGSYGFYLYDLNGRLLFHQNKEIRSDKESLLTVPTLRPGIYLLNVKTENERASFKLMKL